MSSRDDGLDVTPEPPRVGSAEAVDAGPVGPVGIAVAEPAKPRAGNTHDIGPTRAGGGLPPELDPRRPRRRRPRPKHAVRRIVLGVLLVALVIPGWSVGQALTASGTDSVAARLAEWGRGHGGARVVTWAEQLQYRLHPPKTGGTPAGGIPGSTGTDPHVQASRPLHPVPAVVSPALPDEGQWRVLTAVRGHPAVQAAYLRPDATHTSYLAAVAELDPALVRVDLHPGTQEPDHGPWSLPPALPADKTGVVAAFNSGFRLGEAQGGYYSDERTVGTLRPGAASLVIKRDGTATVGPCGAGHCRQHRFSLGCHPRQQALRCPLRSRSHRHRPAGLRRRPQPVRRHPGRPVGPRRLRPSDGARHQPGVDQLQLLRAGTNRGAGGGQAAGQHAAAGAPVGPGT